MSFGPCIEHSQARLRRAVASSKRHWDDQETDVRLDLALGKPEDVSSYLDCIQGARWEGGRAARGSGA